MTVGTIGYALVGCGRIAQRYLGLLGDGQIKGARLAGVCDVRRERAEDAAKRFNVPAFGDMHDMMSAIGDSIDALCILTESGLHAAHTISLAKYGKAIVVEKPMALTLSDADAMMNACDVAGIRLFVVKQNRYNLPVQRLREALERGRFGKLVMGTTRVRWCRTQAYYDQASWRGTWALDGGVFANQASHHIDMLMWMLGEPVSVFAKSRTALASIEAEDTGVAIITFKNGAIGLVEATTATRPTDLEGSLSILGEKGSVEIGGFSVNQIKTWNFSQTEPADELVKTTGSENPPNVYGFGHQRYLEEVTAALGGSSGPRLVDGLEGRKALELIVALYESAATGVEVKLRFQPSSCRLGVER
jgi:UDP-N-acetyl-2-amino-2-deoxyglucuronate dehydrogenase